MQWIYILSSGDLPVHLIRFFFVPEPINYVEIYVNYVRKFDNIAPPPPQSIEGKNNGLLATKIKSIKSNTPNNYY